MLPSPVLLRTSPGRISPSLGKKPQSESPKMLRGFSLANMGQSEAKALPSWSQTALPVSPVLGSSGSLRAPQAFPPTRKQRDQYEGSRGKAYQRPQAAPLPAREPAGDHFASELRSKQRQRHKCHPPEQTQRTNCSPENPKTLSSSPQGTDPVLCSQAQNRASQLEGRESGSDPFGHVFLLRYHLR